MYAIIFFLILFFQLDAGEYQYQLTAYLQQETDRLKEWVEYHKLVGVEHFYIHPANQEQLTPYLITGEGELFEGDIVAHCKGKTKWLAILDANEFLVPIKGNSIPKILKSYESEISIDSLEFGMTAFPEGESLLEWMTLCAKKQRSLGKSIIGPAGSKKKCEQILIHAYKPATNKNTQKDNLSLRRFIPKLREKLGLTFQEHKTQDSGCGCGH